MATADHDRAGACTVMKIRTHFFYRPRWAAVEHAGTKLDRVLGLEPLRREDTLGDAGVYGLIGAQRLTLKAHVWDLLDRPWHAAARRT